MSGRLCRRACVIFTLVMGLGQVSWAATFTDLLKRVPGPANALVAIDVDRVAKSPLAVRQSWMDKKAVAYEDNPMVLPAQASKVLLAGRLDPETGEFLWKVGLAEMKKIPPMDMIAKAEGGRVDDLAGAPAVWSPRGAYFIKLSPNLLGMIVPANRQYATRWVRAAQKPSEVKVTDYLASTIGYVASGKADIVMAIDLQDAASLKDLQEEFEASNELKKLKVDTEALSRVVAGVKGAALGVKIGDRPSGKAVIEFDRAPSMMKGFAREFVLETVSDAGGHIEDFNNWKGGVVGNTITLEGPLTARGLRELTSVLELPSLEGTESHEDSPGGMPSKAEASLKYFKAIRVLMHDLKRRAKKDKQRFQASMWLKLYYRRIDNLPILNVDEDLLDFGASMSERFKSIRVTADVTTANAKARAAGYRVPAKTYSRGWGYSRRAQRGANLRARQRSEIERKRVKAEERAKGTGEVLDIFTAIESDMAKVRRLLTERYQIEF